MPTFPITATVLDSVTRLTAAHRGMAVLCASHGGAYAAWLAASQGIGAVILHDAGVGRARAGIAGLTLLEDLGVPAAAIAHLSARIGDGADCLARGLLSFVNGPAHGLGLATGMAATEALGLLAAARLIPSTAPPAMSESRFAIDTGSAPGIRVIGIDSASLVAAEDAGHVVVCASHGALLGHDPATAMKVAVRAAVFNDAGGGRHWAGTSRLPALEARGIAAACVSHLSARIGDARSTYKDGYISVLNGTAAGRGGEVGQSCKDFVAAMVAAR
jgi:hypothetical protein